MNIIKSKDLPIHQISLHHQSGEKKSEICGMVSLTGTERVVSHLPLSPLPFPHSQDLLSYSLVTSCSEPPQKTEFGTCSVYQPAVKMHSFGSIRTKKFYIHKNLLAKEASDRNLSGPTTRDSKE